MKGDLGIIEIHHRESQAAEVTGRGVNEEKKKWDQKIEINTTSIL